MDETADETAAQDILGGGASSPAATLALARRLASRKAFGLARRLLELTRERVSPTADGTVYLQTYQKSALYTYKDPDLPLEWRLEKALAILGLPEDLATSTDPETLGLAGAIHKRRWEATGQRQSLERSLAFYLKGFAQDAPAEGRADVLEYLRRPEKRAFLATRDQGYCAINAAYILDLLARDEELGSGQQGLLAPTAPGRRADALRVRREIVRAVPPLLRADPSLARQWWFLVTVGEAYFGLGDHPRARKWLIDLPRKARLVTGFAGDGSSPTVPEWEYESTARQLALLARLQETPGTPEKGLLESGAAGVLREFLQGNAPAVASTLRGKLGLGLSGGGFRASFFHIGVLARLAELDLLRQVEVLSCVSGGSIVGAFYYLQLRELLQETPDQQLGREQYLGLIQTLSREFLKGVQRNIRMRVIGDAWSNLKMAFSSGYSRTQKVGELYEQELYRRVYQQDPPDPTGARQGKKAPEALWLDELFIRPKGKDGHPIADFHPRKHNWGRRNKVPTLILNAATLNTGHGWQFTASFMGEPPQPIRADIDANERLRRMYYRDAPERYRKVRLGHAVAASACVPGLFEPLTFDGLYPGRRVCLVDGGVCDNQGLSSLLEQDCSLLVVSDGSGQMETEAVPGRGPLQVPVRSNSILQARVREAQYVDVTARHRAGTVRELAFMHLRQGLPGESVTWLDCPAGREESDFERQARASRDRTPYGIALDLQRKLAAIRTDLDAFNDAEAYALMASGYQIARLQLAASPGLLGPEPAGPDVDWEFLKIRRHLAPGRAGPADAPLAHLLAVSSQMAFKAWRLSPSLRVARWVLLVGAGAAVAAAVARWWGARLLPDWLMSFLQELTLGGAARAALGTGLVAAAGWAVKRLFGAQLEWVVVKALTVRETLWRFGAGVMLAVVGSLVARVQLAVFDRLYLRQGKLERFGGPDTSGRGDGSDDGH